MKFKKITIEFIPYSEQRQSTGGRWIYDEEGNCTIFISEMDDPFLMVPVIVHELYEMVWCMKNGITTEKADEFDDMYEGLYKAGKVPLDQDAGSDPRCPYYAGHKLGELGEFFTCLAFGKDFWEYCRAWDYKMIKESEGGSPKNS